MGVLTIRGVDDAVKAALKERAEREGVSQAYLARRLLTEGLGVKIKKRDLRGLGERLFTKEEREELGKIDWEAPCFTDEELDRFMDEEDQRIEEGMAQAAKRVGT